MRSRPNPARFVLRLLEALLGHGVNPALVAGLLLMPSVVAIGYVADRPDHAVLSAVLRGSFDGLATSVVPDPQAPF